MVLRCIEATENGVPTRSGEQRLTIDNHPDLGFHELPFVAGVSHHVVILSLQT